MKTIISTETAIKTNLEIKIKDILQIIESSTGRTKEYLLAHPNERLINKDTLKKKLKQYKNNCPIAYITGYKCFYLDKFTVTQHTLIPRNETEILVEKALRSISTSRKSVINILEIGTGSGCIAISILKNSPKNIKIKILATELSEHALAVANKNAKNLLNSEQRSNLEFVLADIIPNNTKNIFDIIISNPPYIPTDKINILPSSVKDYEPIMALDGGKDGKFFFRKIQERTGNLSNNNTIYLFEGYSGNIYVSNKQDLSKTIRDMKY